MPWVNAFKAVEKLLAFVRSVKDNGLMNGQGRTNRSIKKINEGQTGEETVNEPKADSNLLPRHIVF